VFLFVIATSAASAKSPKNIMLILADDLGWADTTLYGKTSLYETPNIERLAARGMTFSRAYASPICSPTRASIMTGQNPARLGMTAPAAHLAVERFEAIANQNGPPHQKSTNVRSTTRLDRTLPTIGKILKNAGYATAHFGKWHLGREPHSPLQLGFEVDVPHWYGPGPKASYLAPWAHRQRQYRIQLDAGHSPYQDPNAQLDPPRKKTRASLIKMIERLDLEIGRVIKTLVDLGIADNTLVIMTSDNGGAQGVARNLPLSGAKQMLQEGASACH
jgi:arylsulfatase A-like enzyme